MQFVIVSFKDLRYDLLFIVGFNLKSVSDDFVVNYEFLSQSSKFNLENTNHYLFLDSHV